MVGGVVGIEACRLEELSVASCTFNLLANILINSLARPRSKTSRGCCNGGYENQECQDSNLRSHSKGKVYNYW